MQFHLLLHLIRKDLRHVWILVTVWLFLLLAQGALIATGFSSSMFDLAWQLAYTALAIGIPLLQGLLIFVLVPLVIQDEPLVGSDAQWFTRPISRVTLLSAKSLFFGLLIILPPVVINFLVLAVNGVQPTDLAAAVPQLLITAASLVLPLALIAALTPSFAQYAIACVVLWIGATTVGMLFQFAKYFGPDAERLLTNPDVTLPMSRGIVASIALLLFSLALLVHQYLSRRTRRTLILSAALLALVLLLQNLWPLDFLKPRDSTDSKLPVDTITLSLDPNFVTTRDALQLRSYQEPKTDAMGFFTAQGLPPNFTLSIRDITATWTPEPTRTLKFHTSQSPLLDNMKWSTAALESALGGARFAGPPTHDGSTFQSTIFSLSAADYAHDQTLSGPYTATIKLLASRYDKVGEIALKPGRQIDLGSTHVTLLTVTRKYNGCHILLRVRTANLWFSPDKTSLPSYLESMTPNLSKSTYILVNHARGEAILADTTFNMDFASLALAAVSPLINRTQPLDFSTQKDGYTIDPAWLADATLIRIDKRDAGEFTRQIHLDQLRILNTKSHR